VLVQGWAPELSYTTPGRPAPPAAGTSDTAPRATA
jgi:hypothetical protein